MTAKPFNIALIGMGRMGSHHFRVANEDPEFNLMAVVEPGQRPKPLQDITIPFFETVEDLLKFRDTSGQTIDACIVASPTQTHFEVVMALIQANISVLVEKPTASTAAQAHQIVSLASQRRVPLAVGHIERCNPAVNAMDLVVRHQLVGKPLHWRSCRAGPYPASVRPGNDVFLDLAVHELDVLLRLAGNVRLEHGYSQCVKTNGLADIADLNIVLGETTPGTLHVNWFAPQKLRNLTLFGDRGVATLDYINQTVIVYGQDLTHLNQTPIAYTPLSYPHCQAASLVVEPMEPLKRQLKEFAKLLRGEPHILCSGKDMLVSMELLDRCSQKCLVLGKD